jgi:hypothetical protein
MLTGKQMQRPSQPLARLQAFSLALAQPLQAIQAKRLMHKLTETRKPHQQAKAMQVHWVRLSRMAQQPRQVFQRLRQRAKAWWMELPPLQVQARYLQTVTDSWAGLPLPHQKVQLPLTLKRSQAARQLPPRNHLQRLKPMLTLVTQHLPLPNQALQLIPQQLGGHKRRLSAQQACQPMAV